MRGMGLGSTEGSLLPGEAGCPQRPCCPLLPLPAQTQWGKALCGSTSLSLLVSVRAVVVLPWGDAPQSRGPPFREAPNPHGWSAGLEP